MCLDEKGLFVSQIHLWHHHYLKIYLRLQNVSLSLFVILVNHVSFSVKINCKNYQPNQLSESQNLNSVQTFQVLTISFAKREFINFLIASFVKT